MSHQNDDTLDFPLRPADFTASRPSSSIMTNNAFTLVLSDDPGMSHPNDGDEARRAIELATAVGALAVAVLLTIAWYAL